MTPELAWRPFKHSLVEFPCPNMIDRFVHNDGDRENKLLSLSLQYFFTKHNLGLAKQNICVALSAS